jgi:integrase
VAQEAAPVVPSLAVFWESFFETHVITNNKPSEQATKQRIARGHLLPRFGSKELDKILVKDIELYKAMMLQLGYGPKTINNHLTVLRTALKTAVRWGLIASAAEVKLLRHVPPDVTYLDFDEAERLIQAADDLWRPMIVVALNTGLRIGELIALHWADVDLMKGRLRVTRNDWEGTLGTPKSGKNRDIPLNLAAQQALMALPTRDFARVFTDSQGTPRKYRQSNHALERICKRAGLAPIQWHALRHTFASHLVMKGVPLKAVQELLGHGTQAMTERYAHLSPDMRRNAVAVLDSGENARWKFSPES